MSKSDMQASILRITTYRLYDDNGLRVRLDDLSRVSFVSVVTLPIILLIRPHLLD